LVLAQIRLSKQLDYYDLHLRANHDRLVRQLMGVEVVEGFGFEGIEFSRQCIVDNVSLLNDATMKQINEVIVSFGQGEVFKKRGESFIVKNG
jgi:hypothetical protein